MPTLHSTTTFDQPVRRRSVRIVATVGAASVLAYALFAALQIQVLNPLAAVPGRTLGEIHAAVDAAAESMVVLPMSVVLLIGPLIAAGVAVLGWTGRLSLVATTSVMLYLLVLGTPAYFIASFGTGMSLADTFMIGGADTSPWAQVLYLVSALAVIGLLAVGTRRLWRALAQNRRIAARA